MINSAKGPIKEVVAFRLKPGDDVLLSIIKACEENNVKNGVILCGIGSLKGAKMFNPTPVPTSVSKMGYGYPPSPQELRTGAIELLNISGIICHSDEGAVSPHIHFTVSDELGCAWGGHMVEGNTVLLTVEVVVGVFDKIDMVRKYNEEVAIPVFSPTQL